MTAQDAARHPGPAARVRREANGTPAPDPPSDAVPLPEEPAADGASAKPRAEYSLGAHAGVLRDLLNAPGHDRATLVGQSFGGGVVMQLANQYPERCERPVLVDSGGLGRMGARGSPAGAEVWRSYASLADAETRWAFFL